MANKFRGEAVLAREGEGKNLTLIFDANALVELEELDASYDLDGVLKMFGGADGGTPKLSMRFVRALLYAAAKRNHDLSLQQAGDLISEIGFEEVVRAVTEAMTSAMPEAAEGNAGNGNRHQRRAKSAGAGEKPRKTG